MHISYIAIIFSNREGFELIYFHSFFYLFFFLFASLCIFRIVLI